MRRPSRAPLLALLASAVLAATLAPAAQAGGPPPPDVQAILDKLKAGGHPTDAEQARLRAWASAGASGDTGSGPSLAMPPDVQAIMARAQRGIPPTPAERKRLEQWAKQAKAAVPDVEQHLDTLEAATPDHPEPHGKVVSPFLDLQVTVTQTTIVSAPCSDPQKGRSNVRQTMAGTFKVRARTGVPGAAESVTADVPASGPWTLTLESFDVATISTSTSGFDCDDAVAGTSSTPGMLPPTTFVLGGKGRPLVNQLLLGVSPDVSLPGNPWQLGAVPQMVAAARGATFTLDGEALRKMIAARDIRPLEGTHHYAMDPGGGASQDVTTRFAFAPLGPPPGETELEIVYVDLMGKESVEAWKRWVPDLWMEDAKDVKLFGSPRDPNRLAHAMIKVKGGKRARLKVRLTDVSKYRGITTNYPTTGADEKPDMKLLNPPSGKWAVSDDGQSAELATPTAVAIIDIAPLDTAAEAHVEASSLDDGSLALETTTQHAYLQLPFDADENHIADHWQDVNSVPQGRRSGWDEEALPKLSGQKGDGLSLFEEYRGLVTRKLGEPDSSARWHRLSPEAKKVFISDQTGDARAKAAFDTGVALFARASGLDLTVVPEAYLRTLTHHHHPSWLDFNTPEEMDSRHHTSVEDGRPVAVALPFSDRSVPPRPDELGKNDAGDANASCVFASTLEAEGTAKGNQMERAPIDVEVVALYPDNGGVCMRYRSTIYAVGPKNGAAYLAARGLSAATYGAAVESHFADYQRAQLIYAVLHEFGHAFGVHHHGLDKAAWHSGLISCPVRYLDGDDRWDFPMSLGAWDPARGPWVPPSQAASLRYTQYDYADAPAAWQSDMDADMHAPPPSGNYGAPAVLRVAASGSCTCGPSTATRSRCRDPSRRARRRVTRRPPACARAAWPSARR
ncbi:MAG: hypothetical protein U1F43_07555 [Myxococcota bacterium]